MIDPEPLRRGGTDGEAAEKELAVVPAQTGATSRHDRGDVVVLLGHRQYLMGVNGELDADGLASKCDYGDAYGNPFVKRNPVRRLCQGIIRATVRGAAGNLLFHRDNAVAPVHAYHIQVSITLVAKKYMNAIVRNCRCP